MRQSSGTINVARSIFDHSLFKDGKTPRVTSQLEAPRLWRLVCKPAYRAVPEGWTLFRFVREPGKPLRSRHRLAASFIAP
jgi:hypothetical protein